MATSQTLYFVANRAAVRIGTGPGLGDIVDVSDAGAPLPQRDILAALVRNEFNANGTTAGTMTIMVS